MREGAHSMINWKSAWGQGPKPASKFLPSLRAAVTKQPLAGKTRAPSLRDPLVQLIMNTNNAAQGFDREDALFEQLKEQFRDDTARRALFSALAAQIDVPRAVQVSEMWAVHGPVHRPASETAKRWVTPFHPGVELAVYARLFVELGEPAAGRDLMGGLHLALQSLANGAYASADKRGRNQVLVGWEKLLASETTATFGFAEVETWAIGARKRCLAGRAHDLPPGFADAYCALVGGLDRR